MIFKKRNIHRCESTFTIMILLLAVKKKEMRTKNYKNRATTKINNKNRSKKIKYI